MSFIGATTDETRVGTFQHPLGFTFVHFYRPFKGRASILAKLKWTLKFQRDVKKHLKAKQISVIGARTVNSLIFSQSFRRTHGASVVYDIHELETETIGMKGFRKILMKVIERAFIHKVSALVVVNESIAQWYHKRYNIKTPYSVMAFPDTRWQSTIGDKSKFRVKFAIPESDYVFLYQGGFAKGRRIEQLIEVFEFAKTDRHIIFMGSGELESLIKDAAKRCNRIHFHEAVPPDQLLHYTTSADVGISGVENSCLSYFYALPNKIMEYIHAGIAVLSPDFPEMRKVVIENKCGWVHEESTDSIRTQVNNLTKAEIAEKAANSVVARLSLTWESQEHVLIEAYQSAIAISGE
jgi:glycosyltransferase involved in cell wall biosynthesis